MTSPIIRKQRALAGGGDPLGLARSAAIRHRAGLGAFGVAAGGASVYSGPPVGQGARGGATTGAVQGATVGAVAGPIGAAIGAAIGAIGGAIAGSLNKRDPEQASFDQAVAIWSQNRLGVLNLANLYLPLAGLFDLSLNKPHIPIYQKYGRMGEQKFVTDMMTLVYNAAQSGKITASDTPQTIMVKVVQPWIDSWGFGPMADPHSDLINLLLIGMIADYVAGNQGNWKARSGDFPFGSLPPFSLPSGTSANTAAAYAPNSSVAAAPLSAVQTVAAPASQTAAAQPPTVLTADNSSATANSNTGLRDNQGRVAWLAGPADAQGNYQIYVNGAPVGAAAGLVLLNGGTLYAKNTGGSWFTWNGSAWQNFSGSPVATPAAVATLPTGYTAIGTANGATAYQGPDGNFYSWTGTAMSPITGVVTAGNGASATVVNGVVQPAVANTAVSVPTGYTLIGTANGLSAYQGLDGNYYSWNGTAMSLLTGTLTAANGQSASIVGGVIQPTTASPSLNYATQQNLPPPGSSVYQSYAAAAPAPVQALGTPGIPAPLTAGVDTSGLPSWLTWGAVAAAGYFMFATARPVGHGRGGGSKRRKTK